MTNPLLDFSDLPRFDRKMSDSEGLMWRLDKDPHLSSTFATITILDGPLDFDRLLRHTDRVCKPGRNILTLHFFNAGYAEGVQHFESDLQVVAHAPTYLVARLIYRGDLDPHRVAVISLLNRQWLTNHIRRFDPRSIPEDLGRQLDATNRG